MFNIFQQLLHVVFIDIEKLAVQQGRVNIIAGHRQAQRYGFGLYLFRGQRVRVASSHQLLKTMASSASIRELSNTGVRTKW